MKDLDLLIPTEHRVTHLRTLLLLMLLAGSQLLKAQITCDFTYSSSTTLICAPYFLVANANNTSSSPITERTWTLTGPRNNTLGGGQLNPTYTFILDTAGTYQLTLDAQNSNGQTCTITKTIVVAGKPVINFSFTNTEGCRGLCVQALCNSTAGNGGGAIDSLVIDWRCGALYRDSICPPAPITHCYNCPPGLYDIEVVLFNTRGCNSDSIYRRVVNIITKPVAAFTADDTAANCTSSPLNVNFTANNAGPNMTYCWYIDNVMYQCSTSRTFSHQFPINNTDCYDIKLIVTHPSGCSDTLIKTDYICVRSSPQITFTANDDTACAPFTLVLTNTTPGLASLDWVLNPGGITASGASASFPLTTPGTYTATATGTFAPGCTATTTRQVLVLNATPVASFTASDSFSCKTPLQVTYSATPCTGCTYIWSLPGAFPNNPFGPNPVVTVTYSNFGTFTSTVVVRSPNGCQSQFTKTNFINIKQINPVIGQNRVAGCSPVCVTFDDITNYSTILDPVSSVCWSFPGSSVPGGCGDTITRCLTTPGCYDVRLIVNTQGGCRDTTTLNDTVCVGTQAVCTLTAVPDTVCFEHEPIVFSANCDSPTCFIAIWGDGDITYECDPVFEHFYQDTGNITSIFIPVRDSCAGDSIFIGVRINPPYARFSTTTSCQMGDTVCLVNESGGATHYRWYFCNGDSSHLANPCIVLPPCSTCAVTLWAFNTAYPQCAHQKSQTINTSCGVASVTPDTAEICASRIVTTASATFTNTSLSSIPDSTRWDYNIAVPPGGPQFTNGGNTASPFYNAPGFYTLAMRNVSTSGCVDTVFASVKICKSIANFNNNNACFPDSICFTDLSVDQLCNITFRRWTFGDGTIDTVSINPCHKYDSSGIYNAKLFIRNNMGCRDSITKQVVVSDSVNLDYAVDTLMCPGTTHCITNNSTGILLTYRWDIPNAQPYDTFGTAPCYTINTPGDYWVRVSISSNNLCTTRDSVLVHVHGPVAAGYISEDSLLCPNPPTVIQFISTSTYWDSVVVWNFGDVFEPTSTLDTAAHIYSYPGQYPICLMAISRDGCVDSLCIDTIIVDGPYGIFNFNPTPGICACEDSMHFTVSTVNASAMTFLYGCSEQPIEVINSISPIGSVSNPRVFNFSHYYCRLDSCQPQMIFGDTSGCTVYYAREYIYIDSPVVNFTYDNYGACIDGTVCFFDSTTYALPSYRSFTVGWLWDFGDGATDTSQNPCHVYAQSGIYNVKLYIRSNLGCYDSMITQRVVIPVFPTAGYYADDSIICANTSVCFHDTSTTDTLTGIAFRVWDYGDGNVDTVYVPDVCHLYTTGGFYTVTLCIYDSLGCPDCDSSTIIQVINNPTADAGPDRIVCSGATVNLTGTGGISCQWIPASLVSNANNCNTTTQLYADTSLILIVTDQYQCVDSDTLALSVAQVFAGFAVANSSCLNDSACVTDTSSSVHGTINSWVYDFGNGPSVPGPNACHLYSSTGTYTILEVVTDTNGCVDSVSHVITINPNPVAAFTLSNSVICSNQPLCVTDASTGTAPLSWDWNFGYPGGNFNGNNPPCFIYPAPYSPSYNISLLVTDANNCRDSVIHSVAINEGPTANYSWNASCEVDPMVLTSTSLAGDAAITSCQWTLWLGAPTPTIDSNCNTSFQFPRGAHDVQLIVSDANGCTDTIIKTVITDSIPQLQINGGDTTVCLGTSIDYTVTGTFNNINWSPPIWVSDSSSATVTITPLSDVTYRVSTVSGACGPTGDTVTIHVIQPIPIDLTANPTRIVLGLSSQITSQIPGQIDSIVWSPDGTLDCRDCFNPVATPSQTTTYVATIFYSQDGVTCTNTDSVTITFLNSCDDIPPYLPNTFTPNGDGMNDVFMIRGVAGKKIKYLRVFDRWGKLIFESSNGELNDPRWGWDGNDRNGNKLNPAVFVYTYEIECLNGDVSTGKGNVSLVR